MKKTLYFIIPLIFLNVACSDEVKIERFVWIQHNQNWIWNPDDLQSIFYIEYLDSCNKIKFSYTRTKSHNSDFYISTSPDSLKSLIIKNLYLNSFHHCYPSKEDSTPYVWDGFNYCIIYKFKNQPEKILNYIPPAVPDSLKRFIEYLEQLPNLHSYTKTQPFDKMSLLNDYRDKVIPCGHFAPPPTPDSIQVKYVIP
jgi:hypothetical protein